MHSIALQALRAKIRGFHAAGSTVSSRISKAKKERKNRLWDMKRSLGVHARYHLIAYGILRGVPYDRIERCASTNRPNPQRVLSILMEHNDCPPTAGQRHARYDLPTVEALLATRPEAPTMVHEKGTQ